MNVPTPREKRLPFSRFAAPLALAAASAFIFLSSGDLDGEYLPHRRQLKASEDANAQTAESRKTYPVDFRADLTHNLESTHTGPTQEGSTSTPYFWHIPKAGGTSVLSYYVNCRGLKIGHYDDSVDIVTRPGVIKAREGGLVPSHKMDMLLSPLFHPVVDLFDTDNRGRAFAMFRHPVEIVVSTYYYLQHATWEPTYDAKLADTPIADFAKVGHRRDWMTRNLVGIPWQNELTEEDFDYARQILGDYFLVGLTSKADESTERFDKFFGVPVPTDEQLLANCGGKDSQTVPTMNTIEHPKFEKGNDTFNAIAASHQWDVKLYEFVEALYVDQARFFEEEVKKEASPPLPEVAPVAVVEAVPVPPQEETVPAEVAESSTKLLSVTQANKRQEELQQQGLELPQQEMQLKQTRYIAEPLHLKLNVEDMLAVVKKNAAHRKEKEEFIAHFLKQQQEEARILLRLQMRFGHGGLGVEKADAMERLTGTFMPADEAETDPPTPSPVPLTDDLYIVN